MTGGNCDIEKAWTVKHSTSTLSALKYAYGEEKQLHRIYSLFNKIQGVGGRQDRGQRNKKAVSLLSNERLNCILVRHVRPLPKRILLHCYLILSFLQGAQPIYDAQAVPQILDRTRLWISNLAWATEPYRRPSHHQGPADTTKDTLIWHLWQA